jgi:acyl-CoA reductase-like NAD-dependent aldehyde dehydrogenase
VVVLSLSREIRPGQDQVVRTCGICPAYVALSGSQPARTEPYRDVGSTYHIFELYENVPFTSQPYYYSNSRLSKPIDKPHSTNMADYLTVPLLINGKEVTTSTTFDVISPGTSKKLWSCSSASKSEALEAVSAAGSALSSWSKTKPTFRRDILLRAADLLEKRTEEAHNYMMQETGAVEAFSKFNTTTTLEMFRDVAGRIVSALQGEIPVCQDDGTSALLLKEPYGVILSIAPWNAPYILGLRSLIYALAGGNTVVFKGSELSPRCFWLLGTIFAEAGLPSGCINMIYHRPQDAAEVTTALIEHPLIKKINFTGSTAVGSIIAAAAGKNLKPVLLELGGKASAIICADADLEKAATQCALGAFLHVCKLLAIYLA